MRNDVRNVWTHQYLNSVTIHSYLLAIISRATKIIECGTSFGVATLYLALAVSQSLRDQEEEEGVGVITIEKDVSKVAKARSN